MARVAVRRIRIRSCRISRRNRPLRLVQLSDLHLRCWSGVLAQARRHLQQIEADVVVLTGDIGDSHSHFSRVIELLGRLLDGVRPPLGCYGVLGNHDDRQFWDPVPDHVRILTNEHTTLAGDEHGLILAGIDGRTPASADIPRALYGAEPHSFTILLAHCPSAVYQLPPGRVDLMLAGHTHGGQVRLPLVGPLRPVFDGIPRRYCWGLHRYEATRLYVSAGLGCSWAAPFRLMCSPEITLVTLEHDGQGTPYGIYDDDIA